MKKAGIALILLLLLVAVYFAGPSPADPVYSRQLPSVPSEPEALDTYLENREAIPNLRPGNQARIIWADSSRDITPITFFYLHGFSASHHEGHPVHRNVAAYFGSNLYLSRLYSHGLRENQLNGYTAEKIWESAKEEFTIAQQLGEKVVIISTSTGSTLALKLAAEFPDGIYALINLSPNIRIRQPASRLLNDPWGLQIAKLAYGGAYREIDHKQPEAPNYWDTLYPAAATVELENLLETTMLPQTFEKVICPVLNIYYYKNEEEQDEVVDVSVIPQMHRQLGTSEDQKVLIRLGSPQDHVIASSIKSKDHLSVQEEIIQFCKNVLEIQPNSGESLAGSLAPSKASDEQGE